MAECGGSQFHEGNTASFSVLMSVYRAEKPEFLQAAIDSIFRQTVPPGEFVLVCDGPLTEKLEQVIRSIGNRQAKESANQRGKTMCNRSERISEAEANDDSATQSIQPMKREIKVHVIRLQENRGLWAALNAGIKACSNEIVMRMDSDDIALSDRCEKQLYYMETHPEIDVCSGQIAEFAETPRQITGYRMLPCTDPELRVFAKKRNPINHMAAAFRKGAVLSVGGYRNVPFAEDYDLWVRMLLNGSRLGNLPDTLVYARTGNGMIARRGGWRYAKSSRALQRSFFRSGFLSRGEYVRNCIVRTAVSLFPARARQVFYRKSLRRQAGSLIETT